MPRAPRKNARIDAFVLEALGFDAPGLDAPGLEGARSNPFAPDADFPAFARHRGKIAEHRSLAAAARQRARYDADEDDLEVAAHHEAEAKRLEAELDAAGRGRKKRKNPPRKPTKVSQMVGAKKKLRGKIHDDASGDDIDIVFYYEAVKLDELLPTEKAAGRLPVPALVEKLKAGAWSDIRSREKLLLEPMVISVDGQIHDGHHRYAAAKALGIEYAPCYVVPWETYDTLRALDYEHDLFRDILEESLPVKPPRRRRNPTRAAYDADEVNEDEVDDWVTIEECACHSCTPMRLNPPKRKATGAYADLDSIVPVIAEALAKHGLTLDGLDGGAEGVKFTRGGKSRAGSCAYSPSLRKCKIMFNGLAWPAFTEEQRLNTILHETAHAIQFLETGGSDHGPAWQKIAKSIGCTGDRCMTLEASQAMLDAYAEAKGLPKAKLVTREAAREASADFAVGDYVSFEHKRQRLYGKITRKEELRASVMVTQPATRAGITGKIPYPELQKEAPPRHAEKVAGVDKPAPGESLSAWQARTGRGVR